MTTIEPTEYELSQADILSQDPELQQLNNIDHLSYSTCKKILNKGVDYALGTKLGLIEESKSKAADIGVMVHALTLGGDPEWIVSPYDNYRTKEAQTWKANQTKTIITEKDMEQIITIYEAILKHPLANKLIQSCELEQKLEATINGIKFHGCADGISKDRKTIFDLKTTAQFDSFAGKWFAINQDFDLQEAVYQLFGDNAKYFFVVAETVAPYRVQVFGTSQEFLESGKVKLDEAIREFQSFREREGENDLERISFNIGETKDLNKVTELGDWS